MQKYGNQFFGVIDENGYWLKMSPRPALVVVTRFILLQDPRFSWKWQQFTDLIILSNNCDKKLKKNCIIMYKYSEFHTWI